jgi:hypothetical protein
MQRRVESKSPGEPRYERRHSPRYSLNADLELEWGSTILRGRVCDISVSGMFIETTDPLWIGAGFAARLGLQPPLRVECSVRRVEPGRGMGVTFATPEPDAKARVSSLLGSLADDSRNSPAGSQPTPPK